MAACGYSVVSKMRAYHYSNCIACLFISSLHTAYLVVLQILLCPNTKIFFFFFKAHYGESPDARINTRNISVFICLSILSWQLATFLVNYMLLFVAWFQKRKLHADMSFKHFHLPSSIISDLFMFYVLHQL